jgi:DNA (cytosine-5)-methyltransferase 3A
MKILSLFDGISCGMVALERAGINVDIYYASEIDKNAISISQKNYPNIVRLGDVTKWREWDIDWSQIDILIGGSPCQGFSTAGKQLNFDDPRSKLFFEFADILNHIKKHNQNVKFLLENVKMSNRIRIAIDQTLGVQSFSINSSLFSAQNRERLYWTNIPNIAIPEDKNISVSEALGIPDCKIGQFQPFPRNYKKLGLKRVERMELRTDCKSNAVITNPEKNKIQYFDKEDVERLFPKYRNATARECEILQTLPIEYTNGCGLSNNQRIALIGNGWTVDVIAHIFTSLKRSDTE